MSMRKHIASIIIISMLVGCEKNIVDWLDVIDGTKTNTYIISDKPERIGIEPLKFKVEEKAKIMGKRGEVCVLLTSNYPLRPADEMNKKFMKLMKGAEIISLIKIANKTTIKLGSPNQAWSKYGALGSNDEFYVCMNATIDNSIFPPGTGVSSIEISSDVELVVNGIYWESTNRWDNIN